MPLTNDDVLEIQQLASAYCFLIDDAKAQEWADLFTADGRFEIVDLVVSEGRDALMANVALFPEYLPGFRHIVSNTWITGDGDAATMKAYLSAVKSGDTPSLVQTGRYDDTLVRTEAGWKFSTRTLTLDGKLL